MPTLPGGVGHNGSVTAQSTPATGLNHTLQAMTGRDPHEVGRVSSPLELLFDLTFAVAFSAAGGEFAHLIANGHILPGLIGFSFSSFAIVWAWINFSWFASAFDTDDWLFRITTMVQMVGVVVLALGLPAMFASLEHGDGHFDNRIMVLGYVVMRLAMGFQWLRAWFQCPDRRKECATYLTTITLAQLGWIALALLPLHLGPTLALSALMMVVELTGPYLAEFRDRGTPWHAHHIVERYSLLAIITLGEGIIGTVATLSAVVQEHGWSTEAVLVVVAGIGLTFAMWWIYFAASMPDVLHHHRDRSFGFGYLHIVLFAAIAATGAGLHVAGYVIEGKATISTAWAVASVSIPVALYLLSIFVIWFYMVRRWDLLHTIMLTVAGVLLLVSTWLASTGTDLGVCLLLVVAAPVAIVVGYEMFGHHHLADNLERLTN